jgi:hypothetical protein
MTTSHAWTRDPDQLGWSISANVCRLLTRRSAAPAASRRVPPPTRGGIAQIYSGGQGRASGRRSNRMLAAVIGGWWPGQPGSHCAVSAALRLFHHATSSGSRPGHANTHSRGDRRARRDANLLAGLEDIQLCPRDSTGLICSVDGVGSLQAWHRVQPTASDLPPPHVEDQPVRQARKAGRRTRQNNATVYERSPRGGHVFVSRSSGDLSTCSPLISRTAIAGSADGTAVGRLDHGVRVTGWSRASTCNRNRQPVLRLHEGPTPGVQLDDLHPQPQVGSSTVRRALQTLATPLRGRAITRDGRMC